MRQLKSILLPIDFRMASNAAARVAASLGRTFGSRLTVLHVVDTTPHSADLLPHLLENGHRLLQRFREEYTLKCTVGDASVVPGSPAERILRMAEATDVDLILLGAGEPTYGEPFAMGPVAEAVMQHARQPVLAVRPDQPPLAFCRILCPIDCSSASRRALNNAIRLARTFGGRLTVATVIPDLIPIAAVKETMGAFDAQHQQAWRTHFEEFLKGFDFADVEYAADVRRGIPHRQIVAAAKERDCDLIVMGATSRTGFLRFMLGSVARRVLRDLPCSILAVHDEDLILEDLTEDDIHTNNLLYIEAEALLKADVLEAALAKLDQVLARNPFHVPALEGRAAACDRLGQWERGTRCRQRAEVLRHETWV